MGSSLNIPSCVLLAYPDNPVGHVFFKTFIKNNIPIQAVVVETMGSSQNKGRFLEKIKKDGLKDTLRRIIQILTMKISRQTIVDLAKRHSVPLIKVDTFNGPQGIDALTSLQPALLCIVSAPILKTKVFETASIGCLNAHPGWLPEYRGIGANAHALKNGEKPGVSVHFIDAAIDKGSLLKRERVEVHRNDSVATINDRAVLRGAELMCEVIKLIAQKKHGSVNIDKEKVGPVYRALPYKQVKIINRHIRKNGGIHAL
ncbi:hypothetical protein KAR48_04440 [bacterium]|nr:hypothetical protein [bacterium]